MAAGVLLATMGVAACSSLPGPRSTRTLPADARDSPSSYVVVTVRNAPAVTPTRAASTPRGYDRGAGYRSSAEAIRKARAVAADYELSEVAAWPIGILDVDCLVYRVPQPEGRSTLLNALRRDPRVDSAQPLAVFTVRTSGYNDPYAKLQVNLDAMQIRAAQRWSRGRNVRIAVIDTGIDTGHPDFAGRVADVSDFVSGGVGAYAEPHGTGVAGVIAALPDNGVGIAGIAPDARVLPLRACWMDEASSRGVCNTFTLAQALVAAIDARARIVNLSLGGPNDPLLERIVDRGVRAGVIFVGAVPETGRREGFPTGIGSVLAADVAGRGGPLPRVLYAPGTDVFTLTPGGHYDAASGSSIAAAEITGVAALLLAHRPRLNARDIEALLTESTQAGPSGRGTGTGVNACVALRNLAAEDYDCAPAGATQRGRNGD